MLHHVVHILFRVDNAAATGADMLHLARGDGRVVAHVVAMRQRSGRDIGDNLGVAMRMGGEAGARLNMILDHHTQRSEIVPDRIAITGERERHVVVSPAKILEAALLAAAQKDGGSSGFHI